MEEGLGIELEHVEISAVMIVRHLATPHAEQMVQRLELRRVRRQEHQRQPGAVPLQQVRPLPRFVGSVKPGIIEEDHRPVPAAARPPHRRAPTRASAALYLGPRAPRFLGDTHHGCGEPSHSAPLNT